MFNVCVSVGVGLCLMYVCVCGCMFNVCVSVGVGVCLMYLCGCMFNDLYIIENITYNVESDNRKKHRYQQCNKRLHKLKNIEDSLTPNMWTKHCVR